MRSAAVFDLDGTLADDGHRRKHVETKKKDFNLYYSLMPQDKPKAEVFKLLDMCQKQGMAIVILTGRPEKYREETMMWLAKHRVQYDLLEMRGDNDFRKAAVMKGEVFEKRLKPYYTVKIAFDDDAHIIDMFRSNGVEAVRIA